MTPPSHCSSCGRKLTPFELIPVLSWLALKGKCRTCHTRVSILYPLVEILTSVLFILTWLHFGWTGEFFVAVFATSMFIILSLIDHQIYRLPNKIVLLGVIVIFFVRLAIHPLGVLSYISGALLGFLLLLIIILMSQGGMGFGDAKLFLFVGLYVGFVQTIFTLILASFLGALVGISLRALGRLQKRTAIPFGPYIATAAIVIHLYGSPFITWYVRLLSFH